jgi:hypothetical protein
MADMACVRCQAMVSPQLIDFLDDGAVCRKCIIAAESDPAAIAKGERDLLHSFGRRQTATGVILLVLAIGLFAFSASAGGTIMLVPSGMLVGGIVELTRGLNNLRA